MMRKLLSTTLAVGAMSLASVSHAGFIAIDNVSPAGQTDVVASNNNFAVELASLGIGTYATGYSLATDVAGTVSFYYYGKEAAYNNEFRTAGLPAYSTGYSSYESYFGSPIELGTITVGPGLLDFSFCAYDNGASVGCVSNLANDGLGMGARQSIAMYITDSTAWLFWDDSGAGPDDNHDDMIIKAVFRPTEVPEPATGALLGLGLLAMGAAARGRRNSNKAI